MTPEGSALGGFGGWAVSVMEQGGYAGLVLLIALDAVFPPIPSEIVLPLAGFLTGRGLLIYPLAVLAATMGSVAGALLLYGIGHWLGEERLRSGVAEHGHWLLLDEDDIHRASGWFNHHGGKAVFLGRFVPTVRSLISVPAGVTRMPLGQFVWLTALGSALWNAALIGLGWLLGAYWQTVANYVQPLSTAVMLAGLAAVVVFVWRRGRKRLAHGREH